jgi:hypothetical protein
VIAGGASTAGHKLFASGEKQNIEERQTLHLRTSNRSLRADNFSHWVNLVLDGQPEEAAAQRITFPVFLSRNLEQTRRTLKREALAESRFGLVASSKAARLRPEGLEYDSNFHGEYPWHHWYLSPETDVRSSFACEVFASEFSIQGLELDWIGLCWGGDYVWSEDTWIARQLRHGDVTKWGVVRDPQKQTYRRNSYRVLLTRARQGLIIYVPRGDIADPTRSPIELNRTAHYLKQCGVIPLLEIL